MQNIPPPPPGFVLEGSGAPPPAPRPAAPAPAQGQRQPRGIRNNNPGNIEDGAFARSLPGYAGSDGRFAIFDNPQAGVEAKTRLLGSYLQRGFDTPGEIINRWAPPSDNNPTDRYASYVANRVGVGVNDPVTADQIPLLAQAIGEFENGQQQPVEQARMPPPPPGFEMDNGDPTSAPQALGSQGNPIDLTNLRYQDEYAALKKGAFVRDSYGRTYALPSDAWTGTPDDSSVRQARNVYQDYQTAGDTAMAGMTAFAEQIPFADEAIAGAAGAISGRGYDQVRDQMMQDRQYFNDTQGAARDVGGLAGFATGFAAPGFNWANAARVSANAPRAAQAGAAMERIGRTGALGVGYGGLYGLANTDGDLQTRLNAAQTGAALGGVTGGLLQAGGERFARAAEAAQPNAARRLSRQGVDLTPAQMLAEVPGVGQVARFTEDVVGGFNPFMQGVRLRQSEQVIRAAGNEALAPIGASLPKTANTGYEVAQNVFGRLGAAYDEVLPRVQAQADEQFASELADLVTRAGQTLDDSRLGRLNRILDNSMVNRLSEEGVLTGEQFKRIETSLRQQSERAARPNATLEDMDLAEFLDEARDIARNLVARQNPAEADTIQAINSGYAVAARIRRAVSGSAQMARDGTPLPGELTNTVRQMSSESQRMNQRALLQGLASDARTVLPPTMGDTGSGQRAVLGGLGVLATTGAAAINPVAAGGMAAGMGLYSRPGIGLLNRAYRLADSPGLSARTLAALAAAGRQNAGLPQALQSALLRDQLSAPSRRQEQRPAARGLFGRSGRQTAPQ